MQEKDNGGVIQINYGSSFVTQASQDKRKANSEKIAAYAEKNGLDENDSDLKTFAKKVNEENPMYADITEVVDHIDRVVTLAGIDHVGIGSDYDGVGDTLPYGLKDVTSYPNLIYHLLKRGYSEDDIEKMKDLNKYAYKFPMHSKLKIDIDEAGPLTKI